MAYHEDLFSLAVNLVGRDQPRQADLRRAVSTAYYALFHLLISETTRNWNRDSSRNALGRMFDHGLMKKVSSRVADPARTPYAGENPAHVAALRSVAEAFGDSQDARHTADYDNGKLWSLSEAVEAVETVATAFVRWGEIRHTDIAQEYLVSLLIRPR